MNNWQKHNCSEEVFTDIMAHLQERKNETTNVDFAMSYVAVARLAKLSTHFGEQDIQVSGRDIQSLLQEGNWNDMFKG